MSRVYTPDARLVIATRVMPRRRAWSPLLTITTVLRREGRSPRPSFTVMTKTWSSKPASQHHCSAKMQGVKSASQLHCIGQDAELEARVSIFTAIAKTQGSKPASQLHCNGKTQGSKPVSWYHCNLKTQSLKPASGRVWSPRLARFRVGIQNARLKARVPTIEKLCVSVITALISGSITANVMRGVNLIMDDF